MTPDRCSFILLPQEGERVKELTRRTVGMKI